MKTHYSERSHKLAERKNEVPSVSIFFLLHCNVVCFSEESGR